MRRGSPHMSRDLVAPAKPVLGAEAVDAVHSFALHEELDTRADELSYGSRRRVAIARAAAGRVSMLLLDEPASGSPPTRPALSPTR